MAADSSNTPPDLEIARIGDKIAYSGDPLATVLSATLTYQTDRGYVSVNLYGKNPPFNITRNPQSK